jgi:glutamate N-acetyltransferase/amino-acid N-acetyltransferase
MSAEPDLTPPPLDSEFDLAPGFRAAATACGLKESGALDLTMIVADGVCSAAGVFTSNRVQAAPVVYDREVLTHRRSSIRAVLANSGCANACTGAPGMDDARRSAALLATRLSCAPEEVLLLSTGVIGRRLEMDKIAAGIDALFAPDAARGGAAAARAILTTDTRPKTASVDLSTDGRPIALRGFAKGAGMIHPHMATMLAVLTTDLAVTPGELDGLLRAAVTCSFNRISVDGDRSTNDTVLLLASGASGLRLEGLDPLTRLAFGGALLHLCTNLARQIARDGEGATRLIEVEVGGARDETEAHQVADAIGRSLLVKTAVHGGDPNWGRILAAAGYSGAFIDAGRMSLAFGPESDAVPVVAAGLPLDFDARAASERLRRDPVRITLDLGLGSARVTVWTCDLSAEYVAINAHYTT